VANDVTMEAQAWVDTNIVKAYKKRRKQNRLPVMSKRAWLTDLGRGFVN